VELDEVEKQVEKLRGNILKLGKSETGDKNKSSALKALDGILKQMKTFQQTKSKLDKGIKEATKLVTEIKKFKTEYSKFVQDANKVGTQLNNCKPDTKSRDYFMLANQLQRVGQVTPLEDIPGS
jgi:hypothetical protein